MVAAHSSCSFPFDFLLSDGFLKLDFEHSHGFISLPFIYMYNYYSRFRSRLLKSFMQIVINGN